MNIRDLLDDLHINERELRQMLTDSAGSLHHTFFTWFAAGNYGYFINANSDRYVLWESIAIQNSLRASNPFVAIVDGTNLYQLGDVLGFWSDGHATGVDAFKQVVPNGRVIRQPPLSILTYEDIDFQVGDLIDAHGTYRLE